MKHAFIMDPLEKVKPWKDTTYFLMLAAASRGHRVCHLDQLSLKLVHNRVHARVAWLEIRDDPQRPFVPLDREECDLDLSEIDVVWIRTDPPVDRRYLYTTLLLDHLPPTTRVLNRPSAIRDWNEKLAALRYPDLTPPTLVSNEVDAIEQFSRTVGRITIKPIDGFGGKGIVFYDAAADPATLDAATRNGRHWVVAQQYLPAARQGDKRILLLNGEPLGAILRVHAEDGELNNLDAGGVAHPAQLDRRDGEICATMKSGLIEQGVFFAGIDIIGGMLIEVNVTSPTGLQELCRFDGADYHHRIIAALE